MRGEIVVHPWLPNFSVFCDSVMLVSLFLDFHTFTIDCLSAVTTCSSNLNWAVKIVSTHQCDRANTGSEASGVKSNVDRNEKTSVQNVRTVQEHQK